MSNEKFFKNIGLLADEKLQDNILLLNDLLNIALKKPNIEIDQKIFLETMTENMSNVLEVFLKMKNLSLIKPDLDMNKINDLVNKQCFAYLVVIKEVFENNLQEIDDEIVVINSFLNELK